MRPHNNNRAARLSSEIKDNVIVVEKGKEKFEMTKDVNTKIRGDLKVGSKVTVKYESRATDIEVKAK